MTSFLSFVSAGAPALADAATLPPGVTYVLSFLVALGILIFLAGTAVFAYVGTFARYWADDYCYSAVARDSGLLGSIWDWYRASGNRFSTIVMVSVALAPSVAFAGVPRFRMMVSAGSTAMA